ncbi:MAG: hypothetical protein ACKVLL_00600 [Verrucomicrobiales bacterium]
MNREDAFHLLHLPVHDPPQPLKTGDIVELWIDGIGTIFQKIITWKDAL